MGTPVFNSTTFDFRMQHKKVDADISGMTQCSADTFGSLLPDSSCFCEPPPHQLKNYCKPEHIYVGCYNDDPVVPDFERKLDSFVYSVDHCMQLVFDNYYTYGGLKNGNECWGSNLLIGKYDQTDRFMCNATCKNGQECGGNTTNSVYRLNYLKNKVCGANITFVELDVNGEEMAHSKGHLDNPTGDGQNFVWSFGEVFAESFSLSAVRNKNGQVQGFYTGEDCPYLEEGLTFLKWMEKDDGEFSLSALGLSFVGIDDFLPEYTDAQLDASYEAIAAVQLKAEKDRQNQADLQKELEK